MPFDLVFLGHKRELPDLIKSAPSAAIFKETPNWSGDNASAKCVDNGD